MRRLVRPGLFLIVGLLAFGVLWGLTPSGSVLAEEDAPPTPEGEEQGGAVAVRVHLTDGELPADDPMSAEWENIPVSEFNLSPQVHWPERLLDATVKSVRVRGMHDQERVAVLVEYQDPTEDPADAAALEFMVGDQKSHFAHGQKMLQVEGGPVNIWYWKHESGKAVDMSAKGFGTLRPQEQQDVSASGVWKDGTWRVVFSRNLETAGKEEDVQIIPGEWTNVAFAMWDGKLLATGEPKEKGSQKAISSWWYIRAEPQPDRSIFFYGFLGLGIAALFEMALIWKLRKGRAA